MKFFDKIVFVLFAMLLIVGCAVTPSGTLPPTKDVTISSNDLKGVELGITYSFPHSSWLFEGTGIDPKSVLETTLKELKPKQVRLQLYWNWAQDSGKDVLKTDYNLEWQLNLTKKYGVKTVILCVGRKVPHWPEFHVPSWAKNLPEAQQKAALLEYLGKLVDVYGNDARVTHFQVENEPFFSFGEGSPYSDQEAFLQKEIEVVHQHDKLKRQIIVTDSGDQSDWSKAAKAGDVLGVTWYGISHNFLGYREHTVGTPSGWAAKAANIGKPVWLIELQAEAWGPVGNKDLSFEEAQKSMTPARMKQHLRFVLDAKFDHINFWGSEWWLWLKQNGHPEMWDEAKKVFAMNN